MIKRRRSLRCSSPTLDCSNGTLVQVYEITNMGHVCNEKDVRVMTSMGLKSSGGSSAVLATSSLRLSIAVCWAGKVVLLPSRFAGSHFEGGC